MFQRLRRLFSAKVREEELQRRLDELREKIPVPVFWLLGKTQSGKTSVIKFLTGATSAEIGQGFRPCTRFSREYRFPSEEAPLLVFLDTRGLDEPGYDPAEDLALFDAQAHVVVVTAKVLDHAQENLLRHLRTVRASRTQRPVVLLLTCLHEAYPQQQHPQPYPYGTAQEATVVPEDLRRSLAEQRQRFASLVDHVVPIDLTPPEEGFADPHYGGDLLRQVLLHTLPSAYRQTFLTVEEASRSLQGLYERQALPYISFYSVLAATAGAIPVPWLDLLLLPGIQTKMIHHLAQLYGQPFKGKHFAELAGTLGLGLLVRQGIREVTKLIPYVGSVASGALAGATTFALGKAGCFYYSGLQKGHVPQPEELRRYYREQLAIVEKSWSALRGSAAQVPSMDPSRNPS
jgi:uncharacterized protein (DUF697 family)/predicted GTPase